jgi:hypothetical protein
MVSRQIPTTPRRRAETVLLFGVVLGTFACGARYWVCDELESAELAALPERLSQTGLFTATFPEQLGPGVLAYRPEFELWSDGATKRRWLWLPEGTTIDGTNPDDWSFPVGSKFWKEFTRAGVRVETRLLTRWGAGEGEWAGAAYIWSSDQSEASIAPYGAVDVMGTLHDVPAANECVACHGGRRSHILGVSAIQLAHAAQPGELALDDLNQARLLSPPIEATVAVPGTPNERAALGYLHANCGHCHNQQRPARAGARCFDPDDRLDFWLTLDALDSVADTPVLRSGEEVLAPGDPDDSRVIDLVSRRGFLRQMPPLASERVDRDGLELLRTFVAGL